MLICCANLLHQQPSIWITVTLNLRLKMKLVWGAGEPQPEAVMRGITIKLLFYLAERSAAERRKS